jgi:nitroreductase
MRRETRDTPAFIVVMVDQNPDEITCEEDYAAAVMAEANLIIAAESLGLATYLKTGGIMQDPEVIRLARVPERYRIIGIISLGYPAAAETPRKRTPAAELTDWVE